MIMRLSLVLFLIGFGLVCVKYCYVKGYEERDCDFGVIYCWVVDDIVVV